ncbi:capsular polysaccharide synthesis protein [Desulfosporosinus sp. Sb-LF]|uniref:capsular polysaccharide synthesis protein n=1 Tax=Desulfosporosinus sp. Sb-LF TaxID=2560027 RepID=UPI00107F9737|nr:capsular polysaccharide synthesis protein [Desulfosporosinus sp. Sb-LF]TGE31900.1 hypothetical protein E4K68_14505 [Desulfosporosinus sp. Sb-LF]
MNEAKLKKELANVKLLVEYFTEYGFWLGFWSFADGFVRRVGAMRLYEKMHFKRHETCKTYLRAHYSNIINKYKAKKTYSLSEKIENDAPIWTFWWQGEDKTLYPVNLCLESIKRNSANHPVIVLDKDNYKDYADVPDFIVKKFEEGKISIAAFSDILRITLLKQHGGIWLDSTYYVTAPLQKEFYDCCFFSISNNELRKWVVSKDLWSLSLLASGRNNDFINYCYDMLMEYWSKEDTIICYLILDCIIGIGFEEITDFEKLIRKVPTNNMGVFDFLEPIRNEKVDEVHYQKLIQRAYIHKLTYKEKYEPVVNGNKTYFGRLIED